MTDVKPLTAEKLATWRKIAKDHPSTYTDFHNIVIPALATIDALTAERNASLRECAEWARKAGEAEGRLLGSEAAGAVASWQEEAQRMRAERDALRDALVPFANPVCVVSEGPAFGPYVIVEVLQSEVSAARIACAKAGGGE